MCSVITAMQTRYDPEGDVTLPVEKYCHHLRVKKNEVLLGDFAAVTGDRNPRRACPSRAQRLMCLIASAFFLLPGGPVEHRERGRPRPGCVRQHVRPQQLQTRPPGSQAGAGGVRGEHHGIR